MKRSNYETDDSSFPAAAYIVQGWKGIAWHVYGWETEPNEDTEWSGIENHTGRVVAVMVGDDRRFVFDLDELTAIEREAYCGECGQVGCTHDSMDREEN